MRIHSADIDDGDVEIDELTVNEKRVPSAQEKIQDRSFVFWFSPWQLGHRCTYLTYLCEKDRKVFPWLFVARFCFSAQQECIKNSL